MTENGKVHKEPHVIRLYLIRHARAKHDEDSELPPQSKQDAQALAHGLSYCIGTSRVRLLTSPRPEAQQTTHILAQALGGVPIVEEPLLTGTNIDIQQEQQRVWNSCIDLKNPDPLDIDRMYLSGDARFDNNPAFEGRREVGLRAFTWLDRVITEFKEGFLPEHVVVVTHSEIVHHLGKHLDIDDEPLRQCEILNMNLERDDTDVVIRTVLRGKLGHEIRCPPYRNPILLSEQFKLGPLSLSA